MPRKATRKETVKKKTIEDMKTLGVYKAEYDRVIDIYSELCEQYELLTKKFVDSGYKFEEFTADGGMKKAPIVATLESLRKDILQYSDRLCLNPKAMAKDAPVKGEKSALAKALSELGKE